MPHSQLNKKEKRVLLALSGPFAIVKRPFLPVAAKLDMEEAELLDYIRSFKKRGIIRRLGIMLSHRQVGLSANALVAWKVPRAQVAKTAAVLTAYPQVTHCYRRKAYKQWPYNLYSMVHSQNREDCLALVDRMTAETGIAEYKILFTVKEFKKAKTDLASVWK